MKRSGFRHKIGKPMKRTKLKKVSKMPISKLQREIWQLCREIANIIYPSDCFTCPQKGLVGSNRQLGHMWAKASLGAFLKYDLRILRWQCFSCNIHKGGMGADFYKRLLDEQGGEFMELLEKDRNKIVNAYDYYLELRDRYKKYLEELKQSYPQK